MFVAQSPGEIEDENGWPLSGPSGLLLKEACAEIGWDIDYLYKTNVLHCHPPGNKNAIRWEQACRSWLLQEIHRVKPKLIIALGDRAYRAFMPHEPSPITQIRGNIFKQEVIDGHPVWIMPTVHPAFVLRNQTALRAGFVRDLQKARDELEGKLTYSTTPFRKGAASWDEVLKIVQTPNMPFGLDVETAPAKWEWATNAEGDDYIKDTPTEALNRNAQIVGVGVCNTPGNGCYYPFEDEAEAQAKLPELKAVLEDPTQTKIISNAKFERHIFENYNITIRGYEDTMLQSWILGDHPLGLKDAVHKAFGIQMTRIDEVIGRGKRHEISMRRAQHENWHDAVAYAGQDPDASLRLHAYQIDLLKKRDLEPLYRDIELPFVEVIIEMERNGMLFENDALDDARKILTAKVETLKADIYEMTQMEFSINSPQQVAYALFGMAGVSPQSLKKPTIALIDRYGEPAHDYLLPEPWFNPLINQNASTDKTTLGQHIGNYLVRAVLTYRAVYKLLNTYINKLHTFVEDDGRIHTTIKQTGAGTGRISSEKPNLTNIPARTREDVEVGVKPATIRKAFVTKHGWYVSAPDLSQMEMRCAASLSGDEKMIALLSDPDGDIHSNTAESIYRLREDQVTPDEWKNMRYLAKTIGFGVLYWLTEHGLILRTPTLGLTLKQAKAFIDGMYNEYKRLRPWQLEVIRNAKRLGYGITLDGRRRYFPDLQADDRTLRQNAERAAVNFPVQGTAADRFKDVQLAVKDKILELEMETRLILQVHDELVMEGPEKELDLIASEIVPLMSEVAAKGLVVPVPVDLEYGPNWGELTKWKAAA